MSSQIYSTTKRFQAIQFDGSNVVDIEKFSGLSAKLYNISQPSNERYVELYNQDTDFSLKVKFSDYLVKVDGSKSFFQSIGKRAFKILFGM